MLLTTKKWLLCDGSLCFYGDSLLHICRKMRRMILKILFRLRRPGQLQVLFVARILTCSQSLTYYCQPKCRLGLLLGCHGNRSSTRVLAATGCLEAFFRVSSVAVATRTVWVMFFFFFLFLCNRWLCFRSCCDFQHICCKNLSQFRAQVFIPMGNL